MTSQLDAAIDAYLDTLGVESWAPLTSTERDLVRRTLGRAIPQISDSNPVSDAA